MQAMRVIRMNHSDALVMESASPSSTCATERQTVQMATTKILDFAQQVSMDFVALCSFIKPCQIMSHCALLILSSFFSWCTPEFSFVKKKRGLSLKYFSHFLARLVGNSSCKFNLAPQKCNQQKQLEIIF